MFVLGRLFEKIMEFKLWLCGFVLFLYFVFCEVVGIFKFEILEEFEVGIFVVNMVNNFIVGVFKILLGDGKFWF